MRKFYSFLVLCIVLSTANAQQYGNEWINYSQKYYSFKVWQDGIYRIDSLTLANAGIDLTTVNPQNFQLFGRQKQQAIYISGEADGVFNNGDYIEFLGFKNDGWLDSLVYNGSSAMPDLYYSLYNDTARYYLTFNTLTTNLRARAFNDTTFSAYALSPYYTTTSFVKHSNEYYQGPQLEGASQARFVHGEGWYSTRIQGVPTGASFSSIVNTSLAYTGVGAPDSYITAVCASNSNAGILFTGSPNHHLQIKYSSALSLLLDTSFYAYQMVKRTFQVPTSTLNPSTTAVNYDVINDLGVASDIFNIASSTIVYPHIPDLGGSTTANFKVDFNISQPFSNFSIANFGGASPLVYMVGDSVWRTTGQLTGSTLKLLVPNDVSTKPVNCHIFNSVTNITSLNPVNSTGFFTDFSLVTLDSAYIIITHPSLLTGAQAYATYRNSPAGGAHNTIVVTINELYDQFAAGIYKHSIASRRFCDFALDTWPTKPKFLFLIGKSVREASEGVFSATSYGTRSDASAYAQCLVPSFGYPCSDNRITAGLNGTYLDPAIATGRLAANNNTQVDDYLQKMIEYEQAQQYGVYTKNDKDWMKHVLQFGGGSNASEQAVFATYLNTFKNILEDTSFGGTVQNYFKTSSDPIDPIDFLGVNERLNNGVSLMVFFGHASIGGFDQNIDDVNNWQNQGKYPLLVGNACYTGDIHQPNALSVSEDFTLIPDKGVIGFLSTAKQGFVNELEQYSHKFLEDLSRVNYGLSVGEHIQNSVKLNQALIILTDSLNAIPPEEVYTGMTLHGDPALKVNTHEKPELVIEYSDAYISPSSITLADDSMEVHLEITNLGRGTNETFTANLTRTFPLGNGDSTYAVVVNGVHYKKEIIFKIPVYHTIAFGTNHFKITIDVENDVVDELYDEYNNNVIDFDYTISGNAIFPVYPYQYAIVPDSIITFSASTVNPLAASKAYRFELDTTDAFDSPFKRFLVVNSSGGVVTVPGNNWLLQSTGVVTPLVHTDSAVYFWRVSPDSTTFIWQESSYQYIHDKEGWGQSHFFQFKNNDYAHLNYNKPARVWDFDALNDVIRVDVIGFPLPGETYLNGWFINGQNQEYDGVGGGDYNPGIIYVAVIDPFDPDPWHTHDGYSCAPEVGANAKCFGHFNNAACDGAGGRCWRGEYYFGFRQSHPEEMDSLVDMINNDIPCGHYFMMWTYVAANFDEWDAHNLNLYSLYTSLGVPVPAPFSGAPNRPIIVMGRKCDTSSTKYLFGDTIHTGTILSLSDTLSGILPGGMESTLIGPSADWNSLYWKQHPMDAGFTGDSTVLLLYGVDMAGVETKIFDTLFSPYDSILNLQSIVDPALYPYLRIEARTVDNVTLTPAYFERWQVLYTPVPEAALNPTDGFYLTATADSIAEGDDFKFAMAIKNISPYHMDSLLVHYWVEDQYHVRHYITYARQDSLKSGEILLDTVTIPTTNYPGANFLWIEANPVPLLGTMGVYDQLEQYHFNNIARIPFTVSSDNENPILDVTFDGRHILNGDIVSAKPFVSISLDDENEFLIMNSPGDTSRFLVYLTAPGQVEKRVYFMQGGVEQLNFIPAGSDNKCKIEWNANFVSDGTYTLRVKAWDLSDNRSGNGPNGEGYKIQFEVVLKQTITHVMNYPNPFSTRTHFVFTLTGSEVPQYIKIQIFTVSGKVIREITTDELGPLYIGKNVTEYTWDGKDEFGDQLANGVYFYRVIAKDSGLKDIENRATDADQYFKKEFGKMYLMR
jgi:Peptidase family C25